MELCTIKLTSIYKDYCNFVENMETNHFHMMLKLMLLKVRVTFE